MMLISRDIQVGDKYYKPSENKEYEVKDEVHVLAIQNTKDGFKVVGEISPEATWVKEGDEFDEDDWRTADGGLVFNKKKILAMRLPPPFTIQIKGPCGHFH